MAQMIKVMDRPPTPSIRYGEVHIMKKAVSFLIVAAIVAGGGVRPSTAATPLPAGQRQGDVPHNAPLAARPPRPVPPPAPLPDFKALRVWVGKVRAGRGMIPEPLTAAVSPGDGVQLVCEYLNAGSDTGCAAGGCAGKVVLSADGQQVGSQPLQGAPGGKKMIATAPWRPATAGTHTISCDLVPSAGVVETQAGNNHAGGSLAVMSVIKAPLAGKAAAGKTLDLLPPDLRVTELTVDDATCAVNAVMENAGGPMHYDALVRLYQDGVLAGALLKECAWPKGAHSTICRGYCVYNQPYAPGSVRCTVPGDHTINAQVVTNPAEKVASQTTLHRQTTLHARQDLALDGLRADPLGRLSVVVSNRGLCDSGTWSVIASTNGQQFAASPTLGGMVRNKQGGWLINPQPPTGTQQIFVKVLPTRPQDELNSGNNSALVSISTVQSAFDLRPVDIRLAGDYDPLSPDPWANEQAYMVVPVIRNIGNTDMPGIVLHYKVFIDGVDANAIGECHTGLAAGAELAWSSYCLTKVVIPKGQHQVQFVITTNDANVHNNSLTKSLYRP